MSSITIQPNFLYIGAGKAASTWMFEILREHTQVFVPNAKDIMFFDRYYDAGIGWYLSHFEKAAGYEAVGELSHDYFLREEYAERIRRHLPNTKIMICLREGVDRTFSEYLYDRTLFQFVSAAKYESGFSFEEFARLPQIQQRSNYLANLRHFFDRFPRERILIQFYEDLEPNPRAFARQIFEFLDVDPNFNPPSLRRRVNAARQVRSTLLANFAYRIGQLLRNVGMADIVGGVKRQSWLESLLYKRYQSNLAKPKVPPAVRARLHQLYHRNDDRLAELIGRPVPSTWKLPTTIDNSLTFPISRACDGIFEASPAGFV